MSPRTKTATQTSTNGNGHSKSFGELKSVEWIAVRDLHLDDRVNRRLIDAWAKDIAANFDPDKFGIIHVSRRANGRYVILDGQHRITALKLLGWTEQKVPCLIYTGLERPNEAKSMRGINTFRRLRAYDDFRIAMTEKEPEAMAIVRIVNKHQFRVYDQYEENAIAAVGALRKVYRADPEALDRVLGILRAAWGGHPDSTNGAIIQGLAALIARYPTISDEELAHKLAPFTGGPLGLLGKGRSLKDIHGSTVANNVGAACVMAYNKGRRKGQLESWWAR